MTYQHAEVSGSGQAIQAGRDVHVHHGDGARRMASPATAGECPYPGLAAFTTEQAGWFFGRDALTAHLVGRLADRLTEGRPVLVVGSSGAGKSSLLRAGLLAAVSERGALPVVGSRDWPQVVLTPSARPLAALTEALARAFPAEDVAPWLSSPETLASAVPSRLVVVVDQLEELFALCGDEAERHRFLDLLAGIAGVVVFGLRTDAYAHCLKYPILREAAQNGQVVVGPMTDAELRQAVVCPAHEVGLDLEPGLVDLLLHDLGVTADGYEAGRLPLLAHALRALWSERHGHLLTAAGYRTNGGISDAVATTAELAYARLDDADRRTARALFPRLVRIGDNRTGDTRRSVPRADLPGDGGVLDAFVAARLLTQDRDNVTITHEVLLRAWPRLRRWLDDDRADHLTRQQLEDAATAWVRHGRDSGLLLRGNRLDAARTWHQTTSDVLTPAGAAFYTTSIRHHTKARRRRQALFAVLAVLTLVATLTAGVALDQRRTAETALKQVVATQLVEEAQRLRDTDTPDNRTLAAQLDLVAWEFGQDTGTPDPVVDTGLTIDAASVHSAPAEGNSSRGEAHLVFSPDDRTLAVSMDSDERGLVRFWHIDDWRRIRPLPGTIRIGDAVVTAIRFNPSGRLLAVSTNEGNVQLWRMPWPRSPQYVHTIDDSGDRTQLESLQMPPLPLQDYPYQFAAFVDDKVLAVGHQATTRQDVDVSTARLWDVSNPARPTPFAAPLTYLGRPTGLVEVNTKRHIVITSPDDDDHPVTQVWDVTDPSRPLVERTLNIPTRSNADKNMSITRNGHIITVPDWQGGRTLTRWDITRQPNSNEIGKFPATDDHSIPFVAQSADNDTVATYNRGTHAIQLWDTTTPADIRKVGQPLIAYREEPWSVDFSPDGRLLASVSYATEAHDEQPGYALQLLNLNTQDNVRHLCATTPEITEDQWRRYIPNLDYSPPCP